MTSFQRTKHCTLIARGKKKWRNLTGTGAKECTWIVEFHRDFAVLNLPVPKSWFLYDDVAAHTHTHTQTRPCKTRARVRCAACKRPAAIACAVQKIPIIHQLCSDSFFFAFGCQVDRQTRRGLVFIVTFRPRAGAMPHGFQHCDIWNDGGPETSHLAICSHFVGQGALHLTPGQTIYGGYDLTMPGCCQSPVVRQEKKHCNL